MVFPNFLAWSSKSPGFNIFYQALSPIPDLLSPKKVSVNIYFKQWLQVIFMIEEITRNTSKNNQYQQILLTWSALEFECLHHLWWGQFLGLWWLMWKVRLLNILTHILTEIAKSTESLEFCTGTNTRS